MSYEELCNKNIGDMNKDELFEFSIGLLGEVHDYEKEIERLNNIIINLDKMFEYYYLGNLKYNQDTVNEIYIKYIKLKELKGSDEDEKTKEN